MGTYIFLLLLSALGAPSYGDVTDCEMSSKQVHYHLRNDLLCDYYSQHRPKIEHRNATKVYVRMIVQSFSYDAYAGMMNVGSWMPMTWMDDHLQWKPSSYDDVDLMQLSASEIWTPDLALYNTYTQSGVQRVLDSGVECLIRNTGKVTCVPPSQHEAICIADLRNYPYEKQKCTLRLGSWVHSGEEIDFQFSNKPVTIDNVQNGEWKILNVSVERFPGKYGCCPNNTYPSLAFIFSIQRLPSYHEATIIIPAVVIIIITLSIFFFNAAENERLYLIIVDVLLHFLFIQNLSWELPKVGDNTPYILLFARDSLVLCLVQFITTVILRRTIKIPVDNVGWISGVVGTLIQSRVGQAILVFDNSVKAVAIAKGDEDGDNIIEKSQGANNVDYVVFATLLDRLLCAIFLIIYITMFIRFIP
ncbi:putative acetylcholine receptor [Trypoxylus dichotomus]